MPESFWHDPRMYQGGSDGFLGPRDPIPLADEAWGCDLEAEVVVVTGDVPQGATRDEALAAVLLVGLTNDVSLRNLIPGELAKGFGFFQSKPASAFSPVFVTPDALGGWWRDGKLHRKLMVDLNGQPFGRAEAGEDMTFDRGGRGRLFLPGGGPHGGDDQRRRARDALPARRRHGAHLGGGRPPPSDLRRDRTGGARGLGRGGAAEVH